MNIKNTIKTLNIISFPRLKAYYADLFVHDKREINKHPENTPFIHITRNYGTHLTMLAGPDFYPKRFETVPYLFGTADRRRILNQLDASIVYCKENDPNALVVYFDGVKFQKVSFEKALKIVHRHMDKIKEQWKKEEH